MRRRQWLSAKEYRRKRVIRKFSGKREKGAPVWPRKNMPSMEKWKIIEKNLEQFNLSNFEEICHSLRQLVFPEIVAGAPCWRVWNICKALAIKWDAQMAEEQENRVYSLNDSRRKPRTVKTEPRPKQLHFDIE